MKYISRERNSHDDIITESSKTLNFFYGNFFGRLILKLLISSFIIFPGITSMRVCKRFITVMISSALVSVVCFFIGLTISYLYSTPVGASIVIVNLAALIIFSAFGGIINFAGKKN